MHPGTNMVTTATSATCGGTTRPTATRCIRRSRSSPTPRSRAIAACAIPRGVGAQGQLGRPAVPRERARPEPEAQAHAVRRLPRPRLGLPRRLQARPPAATCSTRTSKVVPHEDPRAFDKAGAPEGHPPREGHAVHRTATSSRTTTATASSTARRATPSRSTASTATARIDASARTLSTSGPAAPEGGTAISPRCARRSAQRALRVGRASDSIQRSMVDQDLKWEVVAGRRHRSPRRAPHYNAEVAAGEDDPEGRHDVGRRAAAPATLAHANERDDLLHLPHVVDDELLRLPSVDEGEREDADAAQRGRRRRGTGRRTTSRCCATTSSCSAWTARSTENRIAPVRSASAVLVSSQNANREWIYSSSRPCRPKASAGRRSARTCRTRCATKETKTCTDCHVSADDDNNAWMAQLLLQGTNFVNFIGPLRLRGRRASGASRRSR